MESDPFQDLSEQQKQDTLQLMEVANIQKPEEAKHFMEMANFDINNAMHLYLEHGSSSGAQNHLQNNHGNDQQQEQLYSSEPQMFNDDQQHIDPLQQVFSQIYHMQQQQQQVQLDGINPETIRNYQRFKRRKEEEGSLVGKTVSMLGKGGKNIYNSLMPTFIRGDRPGGEEFLSFIRKKKQIKETFDFQKDNFREIQEKAFYQCRPVLVFLYQESSPAQQLQLKLLKEKTLKYEINKSFYCIGILNTSDEAKLIQKYVKSDQWPAMIYFRLNLYEQDEVLDCVTITNQQPETDYYLQKAKQVRQQFYTKKAEDDKIKKLVAQKERQQNMMDNPFLSQEMGFQQQLQQPQYQALQQNQQQEQERQRRIEEERRLKEQQSKEYQESIKQQKEKEQKEWEEEKKKQDEEIEQIIKQQLKEEEIKKKQANIPEEPAEGTANIINLAFRTPDGEKISRRFMLADKIQLVYDYIETNTDIEFENHQREFDLVQTVPYLMLSDKLDQTLDEVFDGSDYELLFIKEK